MADIQKVRYTHEAMADAILSRPGISQNQLAAMFGYTPGWVSQIINSDGFQAYLESRKELLIDPALRLSIEERLRALVVKGMEVLQESLAMNPNPDTAAKALEIGTRALGYGARKDGTTLNATFVVALPEKAQSSAEWAQRAAPVTIEHGS